MNGTVRSDVPVVLIAAVAENGVIGQDGALPWRLKSDMAHFRAATMHRPVVMGRKTWQSLSRKPLPGRTNIVVSRDSTFTAPGALVTPDIEAAMQAARGDALRRGADAIAVIGGADLYSQTMPLADCLLITRVNLKPAGDTRFPPINPSQWREIERCIHDAGPGDETSFAIVKYERVDTGKRAAGFSE